MQVACAMRLGELRFTLVRVVMEINSPVSASHWRHVETGRSFLL